MARMLLSRVWCILLGAPRTGPGPTFFFSTMAHADARKDAYLQEGAFADSGYWDFALLSLYDKGVRSMVLGGVTALSEFGWTERALVGASQVTQFAPAKGALGLLRSVGGVLAHLGLNVALAIGGLGGLMATSDGVFTTEHVLEGLTFVDYVAREAVSQTLGLWHDRSYIPYQLGHTTQLISAGWAPFNPQAPWSRESLEYPRMIDEAEVRRLVRMIRVMGEEALAAARAAKPRPVR